jgi:hypothetical protein
VDDAMEEILINEEAHQIVADSDISERNEFQVSCNSHDRIFPSMHTKFAIINNQL